jgi:hypothetical protein
MQTSPAETLGAGRSHNRASSAPVAAQAHVRAAHVKARSAGRSQIAGD